MSLASWMPGSSLDVRMCHHFCFHEFFYFKLFTIFKNFKASSDNDFASVIVPQVGVKGLSSWVFKLKI